MNKNKNNNEIFPSRSSNGRVDILTSKATVEAPDISNLFAMYDKIPANQCSTFREPTLGQWDETALSISYFSQNNIQLIQNGTRAGVYKKSNGQYTVAPQDCDALKIIMRSIYLQHSVNLDYDIQGQIQALNKMVLDYCIHHVYSEAQGYMKYLHDVSTLAVPLSTPVMTSQNDRRNYKMPSWF